MEYIMADIAKIAEDLSNLTVLEAAELATLLEDKWGVSAAAPVAVAAPGAAAPRRVSEYRWPCAALRPLSGLSSVEGSSGLWCACFGFKMCR